MRAADLVLKIDQWLKKTGKIWSKFLFVFIHSPAGMKFATGRGKRFRNLCCHSDDIGERLGANTTIVVRARILLSFFFQLGRSQDYFFFFLDCCLTNCSKSAARCCCREAMERRKIHNHRILLSFRYIIVYKSTYMYIYMASLLFPFLFHFERLIFLPAI